jgi:hypothetical protein
LNRFASVYIAHIYFFNLSEIGEDTSNIFEKQQMEDEYHLQQHVEARRPRLESLDLFTLSPRKQDSAFNHNDNSKNIASSQTLRKKKNSKDCTKTKRTTSATKKKKNIKKASLSTKKKSGTNNKNFVFSSPTKTRRLSYTHTFHPTPEKVNKNLRLSLDISSHPYGNNSNNSSNSNLIPFDMDEGNSMQFFPSSSNASDSHNDSSSSINHDEQQQQPLINNNSSHYFLDGFFTNTNDIEPQSPRLGPTSFSNFVKTPATITQIRNTGNGESGRGEAKDKIEEDDVIPNNISDNDEEGDDQGYEFNSLDDDVDNNTAAHDLDNFDFDVFSPSTLRQKSVNSSTKNSRSSKNVSMAKRSSNKRKGKKLLSSKKNSNKRKKVHGNGTSRKQKKKEKIVLKELEQWGKDDIAAFDKALYRKRSMDNLDMHAFVSKICLELAPRHLTTKSICMFYKTESHKMLEILQQPRPDKPIIGNDIYTNIKALRIFRKLWASEFQFISLRVLGWDRSSFDLKQQFTDTFINRVNYMLSHKDDDGVSMEVNYNNNVQHQRISMQQQKEPYFALSRQKQNENNFTHNTPIRNINNTNNVNKATSSMAPPSLPSHYNRNAGNPRSPRVGEVAKIHSKAKLSPTSASMTSKSTAPSLPQQISVNKNIVIQLYPRTDRTKSVASCSKSNFNNPMVRYNMLCDKRISLILEALSKRFTVQATIASNPYFFSNEQSPVAHLPRLWPLRAANHKGWGSEHVSLTLYDILSELQQSQQHALNALQLQPPNQVILKLEYDWV